MDLEARPATDCHDEGFFDDLTWLRAKYAHSGITDKNITTMLDACEERAAEEMRRQDALSRLKGGLDACRAVEVAAEADGSGDLGRWFGLQGMVAGFEKCDGLRLDDPAEIKSAAAAAALCLSRCSDLALGAQAAGAALGVIDVSAAAQTVAARPRRCLGARCCR